MAKQTKKPKKKKGSQIIIRFLSLILSIALVALSVLLVLQIINLNMLPMKYLIPITVIVIVFALLIVILTLFKARKRITRTLCFLLVLVISVAYGVGNYYIYKTSKMFDNVTNLTDKITNTVSVAVMAESDINDESGLSGKVVGTCTTEDAEGTQLCISNLEKDGISFTTLDYDSLYDLANDLYNNQIDAIMMNDSMLNAITAIEDFTFITTRTKNVYQTKYYTTRDTSTRSVADRVNVATEPFTVLISGNDSYGSLGETSRSDVNMLVTVNLQTGTVLMTSIPRDTYMEVRCSDQTACNYGQMDKLTHTGLDGIETTEETLENFFGIKINYNVRVNFSSLVNLVNALGGIDITVEPGMALDHFYSNETLEGVTEGENHLDGERALAYARERESYTDGDNQRVKNQQQVLEAIITKITSPSILVNYADFIDACGGAFETNMPADDIQSLMRYVLADMPDWKFESYSLTGTGDYQYCAALGDVASVTWPDDASKQCAVDKINAVLDGKSSDTVESVTTN